MPPAIGSIHARPRFDSGAAELWQWARQRRGSWTCPEATAACGVSSRRCRAIVAALHRAGYLDLVGESENTYQGRMAASWRLSRAGRALSGPPVMVSDQ